MKKILIVEDDILISRYIQETLASASYCVEIANSTEEARSVFSTFMPELVLMDIDLDDTTDGIDLSVQFLADNKDLGIVFLTSDSSDSSLERVNSLNYLNYILKPIDEIQLKTSVHLAFEKLKDIQLAKKDILELLSRLTKSERKILQLLASDLTTIEVADILFVSIKTIDNHRYNICKKLELKAQKNSLLMFVYSNKLEIKNILT
jgi:DNA-binding NarL/FixJ family response regulator